MTESLGFPAYWSDPRFQSKKGNPPKVPDNIYPPHPGEPNGFKQAGLSAADAARISGHSTRVGAAQDMLRYGETLPAIMQAGRWQTAEVGGRYTAKQGARQSAAVRVADRRVKF